MRTHQPTVRRPIFNRYLAVFLTLVAGAVLVSSGVGLYLTYLDTQSRLTHEQRQRIGAQEHDALTPIVRFFAAGSQELEGEVRGVGVPPGLPHPTLAQRRAYIRQGLRSFGIASEIAYFDRAGRERLRVSADGRTVGRGTEDRSSRAAVAAARARGSAYGRVYLKRLPNGQVQTRVPVAVAEGAPGGGVILGQLDLEFLSDAVHVLRNPSPRYAYYVVDAQGRLVARSDLPDTLTLQDVSALPQVRTALASHGSRLGRGDEAISGRDLAGRPVMSSFAYYGPPGWYVIANEAGDVARSALGPALIRTGISLAVFLALAVLASYLLARRMVRPIQAIQHGAARIGEGALDERLDVRTGDELEALADEVNRMAERLGESYAGLEARVAARTRELRRALRELKAVSDHRSRFFAGVSHELRTPLNAIIGFSQVLRAQSHGPLNRPQAECAAEINASGRHLLAVVDDILDLAKIEAGRMELQIGALDLTECLEGCLGLVREGAERAGVALELKSEVGVLLEADERKVRQVVLNLLANAIKFTPEGGSVTVRSNRVGAEARVAVSDSGVGIAPEDLERIFDEFQQVGAGAAEPGTGLGLPLARRLVELHDGSLWVESGLGAGSTFTFTLPLSAHAAPRDPVTLGGGE